MTTNSKGNGVGDYWQIIAEIDASYFVLEQIDEILDTLTNVKIDGFGNPQEHEEARTQILNLINTVVNEVVGDFDMPPAVTGIVPSSVNEANADAAMWAALRNQLRTQQRQALNRIMGGKDD